MANIRPVGLSIRTKTDDADVINTLSRDLVTISQNQVELAKQLDAIQAAIAHLTRTLTPAGKAPPATALRSIHLGSGS